MHVKSRVHESPPHPSFDSTSRLGGGTFGVNAWTQYFTYVQTITQVGVWFNYVSIDRKYVVAYCFRLYGLYLHVALKLASSPSVPPSTSEISPSPECRYVKDYTSYQVGVLKSVEFYPIAQGWHHTYPRRRTCTLTHAMHYAYMSRLRSWVRFPSPAGLFLLDTISGGDGTLHIHVA
jgi:hypothetical protein